MKNKKGGIKMQRFKRGSSRPVFQDVGRNLGRVEGSRYFKQGYLEK